MSTLFLYLANIWLKLSIALLTTSPPPHENFIEPPIVTEPAYHYFMHVGYGSKIVRILVFGSLFWVFLLFLFTLSDVLSRDWLLKLQPQ